jgi:hypothetical protein
MNSNPTEGHVWKRLHVRDASGGVIVTNWYPVHRDDQLTDLVERLHRDGLTVIMIETENWS